uniref:Uncharacterized protein n=1 Tax=Rhizophora mucronata TaxID=61149 RepID=A0A2P2L2W1_RHIMU
MNTLKVYVYFILYIYLFSFSFPPNILFWFIRDCVLWNLKFLSTTLA